VVACRDSVVEVDKLISINSDVWQDPFNKFKEGCINIILIMVLEDLKNKANWVNTLVPIAYWISLVGSNGFSSFLTSFNLNFIMLFIGVILTPIQFYIQDLLWGEKKITIKQFPSIVPYLKQNKFIVFSGIAILAYGFVTFIFMCIGVKNVGVWTLIIFYLIGNLYNVIIKALHFLKYNFGEIFLIGWNWVKK
jgi:hypothetical protein